MIRVHDIPYGVSGVYVLCLQNDVLYVGGSGNIRTRILVHAHNIPFDQIWIEPLKERHEWKRRETELTRLLRPTHNRALPLGFHNDMRIRYMKPGFFKNEDLSALSPMHRLCFAGLWLMADKAGRLEDRPRRIKGELFPYENVEVEPLLDDLTAGGFLLRYCIEGHAFIQIVNFIKHQRPHKDEPASKIPIPAPDTITAIHDRRDSTHDRRDSTQSYLLGSENLMDHTEKLVDQVHGELRTENGERRTENGNKYISATARKTAPSPVKEFLDWFQAEYKRRRHGATYFVKWPAHSAIVKRLLTTFPPDRLKKHAAMLLTTNEEWTEGTDRGVEVLSGKINWLEERLSAWEAKQKGRKSV